MLRMFLNTATVLLFALLNLNSGIKLHQNNKTLIGDSTLVVGETYSFKGTDYLIVDNELLRYRIKNNLPINHIITSKVTDMSHLFYKNTNDIPDISSWDVSNIVDMSSMFSHASNFNSDLSFWDTSQVVLFGDMFRGTKKFNANISAWNVSNGTHFNGMFHDSFFNGPLNSWDMSSAEDLSGMFDDAINFNHPLSRWNVSKVTNMAGMFSEAISFNQDISSWGVSNVTLMTNMFRNADVFSQDLSKWKPNISEKPYEFQRNSYFIPPSFKNQNINNAIGLIMGILIVLGAFFILKKPKINSDNITLFSKELNSFAEKKQLLTKEELDAIFKISDYSFEVQKTTRAKYIRDMNKRKSGFITRIRDEKDKRSFLYLIKK